MYQAKLTTEEKQNLKKLIKHEKQNRVLKRYQCLLMNSEGIENLSIANFVGVSKDTVTLWIKLYLEKGLEEFGTLHFKGKKKSVLDEFKGEIEHHVRNNTVSTMAELSEWLSENFEIEIESSWLGRWCKKNSISLLKSQE